MTPQISFLLDGKIQTIDFEKQSRFSPTTTVLQYLRSLPNHKGVKEGCAEGDCGACTVVIAQVMPNGSLAYQAVNSCLLFLPKLQGRQLITIENLKDENDNLHPVQKAVAEKNGSQCGFCTPGIVMSLFGHYKNDSGTVRDTIEDTLSGNLCRCTGYQPILEAAQEVMATVHPDHFSAAERNTIDLLHSIPKDLLVLKTEKQSYYLPATLDEVLELKSALNNALLIDGSTDVALRVTKKNELLPEIIDVSRIPELKQVHKTNEKLQLGSGLSINQLLQLTQDDFPAIHKICKTFGSGQIRNLATIGGNLGSASPIADLTPVLIALKARIILQSAQKKRSLELDAFFDGYRQTVLQPDEIIKALEIDFPVDNVLVGSYKISKRYDLDIATVSAGFRVELTKDNKINSCRLVYGGMAAFTARAEKAETFLTGKTWNRENIEQAIPLVRDSFSPISDARSGAKYRSLAAGNLLLKFYLENS